MASPATFAYLHTPRLRVTQVSATLISFSVQDTELVRIWEGTVSGAPDVAAFIAAISTDGVGSVFDIPLASGGALPPQAE